MTLHRIAGCTLFAVVAVAAGFLSRPHSADAVDVPPTAASGLELQGVASCAASNCHNGNGRRGEKGSEYTTWLIHDPHARAYDVLLSDRSAQIEHTYRQLKSVKDAHPEKDALCLDCHVQPDALKAPHRPRFALSDGVGCESCHGAAQKWLGPHTTWKNLDTAAKKQAYTANGMVWLHDLGSRAQACATCHVGTGKADVNHALIAAGHPRLTFEFSSYQASMPRHWDEQAEKKRFPDLEARAWALGQAACARAALELLAARAQPADKPWPEFAEYSCFACHQEVRADRRPRSVARGSVPGLLPWSEWYYAMLPQTLAFQPDETSEQIRTTLLELRRSMRRPLPDAVQVTRQARIGADLLKKWVDAADRGQFGNATVLQRTRTTIQELDNGGRTDWDTAMQRYLGMTALYEAQRALKQPAATRDFQTFLQQQAKQLQFPPDFDSPRASGRE